MLLIPTATYLNEPVDENIKEDLRFADDPTDEDSEHNNDHLENKHEARSPKGWGFSARDEVSGRNRFLNPLISFKKRKQMMYQ